VKEEENKGKMIWVEEFGV